MDSIELTFFWMNILDLVLNWIIFRPDSMKKLIFQNRSSRARWGSTAVWNLSDNSSDLVAWPVPKQLIWKSPSRLIVHWGQVTSYTKSASPPWRPPPPLWGQGFRLFFAKNEDENFDASGFGPNCKSLPSISNLRKGSLHYIRHVGWLVGWCHH